MSVSPLTEVKTDILIDVPICDNTPKPIKNNGIPLNLLSSRSRLFSLAQNHHDDPFGLKNLKPISKENMKLPDEDANTGILIDIESCDKDEENNIKSTKTWEDSFDWNLLKNEAQCLAEDIKQSNKEILPNWDRLKSEAQNLAEELEKRGQNNLVSNSESKLVSLQKKTPLKQRILSLDKYSPISNNSPILTDDKELKIPDFLVLDSPESPIKPTQLFSSDNNKVLRSLNEKEPLDEDFYHEENTETTCTSCRRSSIAVTPSLTKPKTNEKQIQRQPLSANNGREFFKTKSNTFTSLKKTSNESNVSGSFRRNSNYRSSAMPRIKSNLSATPTVSNLPPKSNSSVIKSKPIIGARRNPTTSSNYTGYGGAITETPQRKIPIKSTLTTPSRNFVANNNANLIRTAQPSARRSLITPLKATNKSSSLPPHKPQINTPRNGLPVNRTTVGASVVNTNPKVNPSFPQSSFTTPKRRSMIATPSSARPYTSNSSVSTNQPTKFQSKLTLYTPNTTQSQRRGSFVGRTQSLSKNV